jgi:hypothetical protein
LTALRSRRHADLHRVPVRGKHVVSVVEDPGDDLEEERLIPVLSCYTTLPDVRRDLGKTAHEREDRGADLPDPPPLPRPGKADIERSVSRQPSVLDLKQQRPACPLDMREEMSSGFFGHPTRAPHRVDQLEDAGHKPGRISDAFAALVPIPTQADQSENDRRARRSPGPVFGNVP